MPVSGVNPFDQFYVVVTGADTTAFGTGKFALSVNFGSGAMPAVTLPNTKVLNAATLVGGGSVGMVSEALTASMDFLAVSDDYVPLACRMHGSGCGCPACAGAAQVVTQATPEVRWTLPGWALVGADDSPQQKHTDPAILPPTLWAPAPPGNDAFFASQGAADVSPDPTPSPGGGW